MCSSDLPQPVELVDLLLKAGADAKAANRYGATPLYVACQNGSAPVIERLLKAGADAKAASPDGETMLMTAARTGKVEAVKLLLANGADPHVDWENDKPTVVALREIAEGKINSDLLLEADPEPTPAMMPIENPLDLPADSSLPVTSVLAG